MSDVNMFSNKPFFCDKNISISGILNLSHFNALTEIQASTSSYGRCDDKVLGTLFQKHIVHKLIRCGGDPIDLNFMTDMFPATDPTMVTSTTWYNRYKCSLDYNIYAAATVSGTGAGVAFTFQLLKSNHAANGTESIPAVGYQFVDKDNMVWYTITAVDTTVPYAHRVTVIPNDATVTGSIKVNKAYLVLPFKMVGGCACAVPVNSMNTLGYVQALHPARITASWRLCVELLRGYTDDIRYAVTFDMQGNAVDSWYLVQEQDMRLSLRLGLNMMSFFGTPTTNTALISGVNATIDAVHTGFYGMIPTIQTGGGKVYDIRKDQGFDWEADFEPIMLYQGSRKLSKKFTGLHGMKFIFDTNDKSNKMVLRTGLGIQEYDAFRRKDLDEGGTSSLEKLGIRSYDYKGYSVNLKEMESWSDYRLLGSDRWNSTMVLMPHDGIMEDGKKIPPLEFYNYGNGNWTGEYEEFFTDERKMPGQCDYLSGRASQSIGFGLHCPDQWILVNPIDPV